MRLLALLLRSLAALAFLGVLGRVQLFSALLPGANALNALVLGVLGAPGFALLLLLPVILS